VVSMFLAQISRLNELQCSLSTTCGIPLLVLTAQETQCEGTGGGTLQRHLVARQPLLGVHVIKGVQLLETRYYEKMRHQ
jgi:hypothetical protein